MAARTAWVLNLDADLELANAWRSGPYAPRRSVEEAMAPYAVHLSATLLGADDIVVSDSSPRLAARGLRGRAFCPTPRAIAVLRRAGADPEPHPSFEVLRRVNSRAFASGLGTTLPGAAFVTDAAAAHAILLRDPELSDTWRIKRAFGMSGRGQHVTVKGRPSKAALASITAGLREGGIQIEPNVAIDTELALHGILAEDGSLRVGTLVRQRCNARGVWITTEPVAEGALCDVAERLRSEIRSVASALSGAGYFGPFGIDAYTYRDRRGVVHFQPRSEINARYSMGFAIGFGTVASAVAHR